MIIIEQPLFSGYKINACGVVVNPEVHATPARKGTRLNPVEISIAERYPGCWAYAVWVMGNSFGMTGPVSKHAWFCVGPKEHAIYAGAKEAHKYFVANAISKQDLEILKMIETFVKQCEDACHGKLPENIHYSPKPLSILYCERNQEVLGMV